LIGRVIKEANFSKEKKTKKGCGTQNRITREKRGRPSQNRASVKQEKRGTMRTKKRRKDYPCNHEGKRRGTHRFARGGVGKRKNSGQNTTKKHWTSLFQAEIQNDWKKPQRY